MVSVYRLAVLECKTATLWYLSSAALVKSYIEIIAINVGSGPSSGPEGSRGPQGAPSTMEQF